MGNEEGTSGALPAERTGPRSLSLAVTHSVAGSSLSQEGKLWSQENAGLHWKVHCLVG